MVGEASGLGTATVERRNRRGGGGKPPVPVCPTRHPIGRRKKEKPRFRRECQRERRNSVGGDQPSADGSRTAEGDGGGGGGEIAAPEKAKRRYQEDSRRIRLQKLQ